VLTFQLGERVVRAPAGSFIRIPRGMPHAFWNPESETATYITIFSPAGPERWFEEMGERLTAGESLDRTANRELARKYGTEFQ
jgi:mannose-6-phosphate isomerase-like protein (cupin superfamily)